MEPDIAPCSLFKVAINRNKSYIFSNFSVSLLSLEGQRPQAPDSVPEGSSLRQHTTIAPSTGTAVCRMVEDVRGWDLSPQWIWICRLSSILTDSLFQIYIYCKNHSRVLYSLYTLITFRMHWFCFSCLLETLIVLFNRQELGDRQSPSWL